MEASEIQIQMSAKRIGADDLKIPELVSEFVKHRHHDPDPPGFGDKVGTDLDTVCMAGDDVEVVAISLQPAVKETVVTPDTLGIITERPAIKESPVAFGCYSPRAVGGLGGFMLFLWLLWSVPQAMTGPLRALVVV